MFFWQFLIAKHHENDLFWRDPEPLCGTVKRLRGILTLKKALLFTVFIKWDGQTPHWIHVQEFTLKI